MGESEPGEPQGEPQIFLQNKLTENPSGFFLRLKKRVDDLPLHEKSFVLFAVGSLLRLPKKTLPWKTVEDVLSELKREQAATSTSEVFGKPGSDVYEEVERQRRLSLQSIKEEIANLQSQRYDVFILHMVDRAGLSFSRLQENRTLRSTHSVASDWFGEQDKKFKQQIIRFLSLATPIARTYKSQFS